MPLLVLVVSADAEVGAVPAVSVALVIGTTTVAASVLEEVKSHTKRLLSAKDIYGALAGYVASPITTSNGQRALPIPSASP